LDRMRSQGEGPILARLACDYRRELSCGDQLTIETTTEKVGHSSFHLRQVLYKNGETDPAAEAEVVLVWFDYFTHQPQGLAPAVREWLMRYHQSEIS
jgi:acyl-CoA thioester hydrolase